MLGIGGGGGPRRTAPRDPVEVDARGLQVDRRDSRKGRKGRI